MCRNSILCFVMLAGWAPLASAQVVVRAPFVRVQVGGGVWVRAPFVNIYVPSSPRYCLPPPVAIPAPASPAPEQLPAPSRDPEKTEPTSLQPATEARPLTIDEFASAFQPREGNHEVVLLNPLTGVPATVQFSLPAGSPRNVVVSRRELAFVYESGQLVRIRFDRRGARVTSRL